MATAYHTKNTEESVTLTLSVAECFSVTAKLHDITSQDKPLSVEEEHIHSIYNALYNLIAKALNNEGVYHEDI